MRHAVTLILTITLAVACADAPAAATAEERTPPAPLALATASPMAAPTAGTSYDPGPHSTGGSVLSTDGRRLVLRTVEHGDIDVDLGSVRSVWKETEVAASALEAGDDVFANGRWSAGGFVASYVWAGIGRLDGVIRAVEGDVLTLDVSVRVGAGFGTETRRVELSPFVTLVAPLTRSDLLPGRAIGAVVYAPRSGRTRLTRIW